MRSVRLEKMNPSAYTGFHNSPSTLQHALGGVPSDTSFHSLDASWDLESSGFLTLHYLKKRLWAAQEAPWDDVDSGITLRVVLYIYRSRVNHPEANDGRVALGHIGTCCSSICSRHCRASTDRSSALLNAAHMGTHIKA